MTKLLCPVIVFIKIIILYVYVAFNRQMFEKSIKASLGMVEAKCIGTFQEASMDLKTG